MEVLNFFNISVKQDDRLSINEPQTNNASEENKKIEKEILSPLARPENNLKRIDLDPSSIYSKPLEGLIYEKIDPKIVDKYGNPVKIERDSYGTEVTTPSKVRREIGQGKKMPEIRRIEDEFTTWDNSENKSNAKASKLLFSDTPYNDKEKESDKILKKLYDKKSKFKNELSRFDTLIDRSRENALDTTKTEKHINNVTDRVLEQLIEAASKEVKENKDLSRDHLNLSKKHLYRKMTSALNGTDRKLSNIYGTVEHAEKMEK
jgi:hypothetical protein